MKKSTRLLDTFTLIMQHNFPHDYKNGDFFTLLEIYTIIRYLQLNSKLVFSLITVIGYYTIIRFWWVFGIKKE